MARKIENWSDDIFYANNSNLMKYRSLKGRELAIVAAATLDIALAHLIEKKLVGDNKEVEECLGINGDGRAPMGSFGSRIQLGYLLGLITKKEAALFRSVKSIRNKFAHRINLNYQSDEIKVELRQIVKNFNNFPDAYFGGIVSQKKLLERIDEREEYGATILLLTFLYFQSVLNMRINLTEHLNQCLVDTKDSVTISQTHRPSI